jgi:AraC family transcriptional regulator, transcriptional activator of pobA
MKSGIPVFSITEAFSEIQTEILGNHFFISDSTLPAITHTPMRHDFYAIAYCCKGLYKLETDMRECSLGPGSLMFFRPGELHRLINIDDYEGVLIAFTGHFFMSEDKGDMHVLEQPFLENGTDQIILLREEDRLTLSNYIKGIFAVKNKTENPHRYKIVRNLLASIIYELSALYPFGKNAFDIPVSHTGNILKGFEKLLNIHFKKQHNVRFYADRLYVTPGYLSELLKERRGKNASELIREKLLLEAQILLKTTSENIYKISAQLNFSNAASFIRFFKHHTDLPPAKYRKTA